jgi:integrase
MSSDFSKFIKIFVLFFAFLADYLTMPSYHAAYTLYTRKRTNGKPVYYWRTYDENGNRTSGKSTGCTNRRDANKYCRSLISFDMPVKNKSFKNYAGTFFAEDSLWYTDLKLCDAQLSEGYIAAIRSYHQNHIMPYFGDCGLSEIVPSKIKDFRLRLKEKKLTNTTINTICGTLKIITDTATNDGILKIDPFRGVRRLAENKTTHDAFTIDEGKAIISADWKKKNFRDASLIAAVTGLRMGEVMAIRDETLYDNYIDVRDQRDRNKLLPTKGKEKRKVPICPEVHSIIQANIAENGGYAFPYSCSCYRKNLYIAFPGKTRNEQKERRLAFHSWRHLFNTQLLAENVPPHKVAAVIGHSSGVGSMQERYTNWEPEHFPEVYEAQKKLLENLGGRLLQTFKSAHP